MKPADRHAWITAWLTQRSGSFPEKADVLNAAFVNEYIEACGPMPVGVMPYGAHKVPQLGRDLAAMFKAGKLARDTVGIEGLAGMGFPRWCYVYRLNVNNATLTP